MQASPADTISHGCANPSEAEHIHPGLPATAYTSDEFWEMERSTLFPNSWVFSGFCHELPNVGDVVPVTVGGHSIFLARSNDHSVKAFHNVCRHRCLELVDHPKNVGRLIRCPYHSWSYSLDGRLQATPYFGGRDPQSVPSGFVRENYGLKEIRCETWHDWIFINLNGNAQEFDDFLAPLQKRLQGLDLDRIVLAGVLDFGVVDANWKLLMENFIEPYHVQFVHSTTTAQPLTDHYTIVDGNCLGSAVDLGDPEDGEIDDGSSLSVSSRYLTLFPSFAFGRYFPDQIGIYLNLPLGPGKTLQRRAIYMTDDVTLNDAETTRLMRLWDKVHREDHEMCVRLQRGRNSSAAQEGGILSPYWEDSVRCFQHLVREAVEKA